MIDSEKQSSHFVRDTLRPMSWGYVGVLLLLLILSVVVYLWIDGDPLSPLGMLPLQLVYFSILGVMVYRRVIAVKGGLANVLAPDVCFVAFYTAVHLGYITLYTIGVADFSDEAILFPSSVRKSLFIVNLGVVSFLIGAELGAPSSRRLWRTRSLLMPCSAWGGLGAFLIGAGIIIHIFGVMSLGLDLVARHGYGAIQNAQQYTDSFVTKAAIGYGIHMVGLGIILYCICSTLRYRKLFASPVVLGMVVFVFVVMIAEGDRGPLVKFGLPLLLIHHYMVRPIKIRYVAAITLAMMVLFVGLGVVRSYALNPVAMIEELEYRQERDEARWYYALVELGHSFNTLNVTAHEVPKHEPYWRGASWRDSAIHIIPFAQGVMLRAGIGTWAPSTWVTEEYWGKDRAGRAFTVTGEGYLNFGYLGVFIELCALGLFVRWLFVRFCLRPSAVRGLVMLGCYASAVLVIRDHLNLLIAPCAQIFLIAWILGKVLGNEVSWSNQGGSS